MIKWHFLFSHLITLGVQGLFAQTNIEAENIILQMLANDSSSNTTIYLNPSLKFGLSWIGNSYLIAAKEKSKTYFILSGSQRVYELHAEASGNPKLIRLDSSTHFGDNYNCMGFLFHDTLYQYGGYGFWENRNFFTRFSKKSAEWEFIQGGDLLENTLLLSWLDRKNGQFYIFGQHDQETSKDFNPVFNDSIFRYDIKTKEWISLGKINPLIDPLNYKKTLMYDAAFETPFGLGVVSLNGEIELIDFQQNKVIPLKKILKDSILGKFRNANRSLNMPQINYLYLGNKLYYIAFDEVKYSISSALFDSTALDKANAVPLYLKKETSVNSFVFKEHNWIFLLATAMLLTIFLLFKKIKKTQYPIVDIIPTMPAVNIQSVNQKVDFITTLSAVELELLKELMNYANQRRKMSTEVINRILGVSNKDAESQKGRRSQVITHINQLYSVYSNSSNTLILRERDEKDKRAYLYFIAIAHQEYLKELLNKI